MKLPIKRVEQSAKDNTSCDGCVFDAVISQEGYTKDQLCDLIRWNTPIDPSRYCGSTSIFVADESETNK